MADGGLNQFFGGLERATTALIEGGKQATWTLVGGATFLGVTLLLFDQSWFVASSLTQSVLGVASMSLGAVLGQRIEARKPPALPPAPTRKALPPARDA
jgi:hypothetical protein